MRSEVGGAGVSEPDEREAWWKREGVPLPDDDPRAARADEMVPKSRLVSAEARVQSLTKALKGVLTEHRVSARKVPPRLGCEWRAVCSCGWEASGQYGSEGAAKAYGGDHIVGAREAAWEAAKAAYAAARAALPAHDEEPGGDLVLDDEEAARFDALAARRVPRMCKPVPVEGACPNCDDGVVMAAGKMVGEEPVGEPVPEPCSTCGGSGTVPVPVAKNDYKLSERCEASLVGQRCELPAGHAGRHQVEHGEKRGRYHRWESPVPVEGACTHSQRTGDGSGHWQCDLCGVEGWGAEVFDGKPCPEHRWMGRVAGTRAPCPHCPVEGEAATPDCSQSVQGLGTTGEGDADR